jgi:pimeloyl-ACP methyl ester carboxylesterase
LFSTTAPAGITCRGGSRPGVREQYRVTVFDARAGGVSLGTWPWAAASGTDLIALMEHPIEQAHVVAQSMGDRQ